MLDGAFNDIQPSAFSRIPDVPGAGIGFDVRTEEELEEALAAAREHTDSFTILDVHLALGDHFQAPQRLTKALAKRMRA